MTISVYDADPCKDFCAVRLHPTALGEDTYRVTYRGATRTCEVSRDEFDLAGMMAENGRAWIAPHDMDRWNRPILRLASYGMVEIEPGPKEGGGIVIASTDLMGLFFAKAREEEAPLSVARGPREAADGGRLVHFKGEGGAGAGRQFSCHLTPAQERIIRRIHFGDFDGLWPQSAWGSLADQGLIEDPRKTKDLRLRLTPVGASVARALAAWARAEEEDEARRIAGEAAGEISREGLVLLALAMRELVRCAQQGREHLSDRGERVMAFADRLYKGAWS